MAGQALFGLAALAVVALLLATSANCAVGLRVAFVPAAHFRSHVAVYNAAAATVARAGHEVFFVTTEHDRDWLHSTDLFADTLSYEGIPNDMYLSETRALNLLTDALATTVGMLNLTAMQLDKFLASKMGDRIDALGADVVVVDPGNIGATLMAGELEMNAVSLAPNSWLEPFFATQVGAPPMPGLYPNLGVNAATPLSFPGRLKNVLIGLVLEIMAPYFQSFYAPVLEAHGRARMPPSQYFRPMLMNTSPALMAPRPIPPCFEAIGSLLAREASPVGGAVGEWLDGGDDGRPVIYVSLGTLVFAREDFMLAFRDGLLALSRSVRIIWRLRSDNMYSIDPAALPAKDFFVSSWLPQNDILGDKRVAAFVTHGGLNSVLETLYHGTPAVGVPFVIDQYPNVIDVERVGAGVWIDKEDLTAAALEDAVLRVIRDPSFSKGAARASAIMHQDRPHERIVRWIERVGVLGTDFLRPPTRDVGLVAAFALDAVAVLVAFVIAVLIALCCLARCAWRCCCGGSTTGTKAKVA